jgi:hypothetical protein
MCDGHARRDDQRVGVRACHHEPDFVALEPATILQLRRIAFYIGEIASAWQPIISEEGNGQAWLE